MKITMIELLGMVKDGKAPKRFKYDSYVWTYNYESSAYWNGKGIEFEYYMDDGLMKYLNDEVEIIEEDTPAQNQRIERLNLLGEMNLPFVFFKVNEIIDYLKSKGDE